jgi:molybdenum cofactor cytidylyltransferase
MSLKVLGVVPAAGRSTRMGSPKPLLDADGPTFLARVVGILREGGASTVVVGVRESPGPVAAEARGAGARLVVPDDVEAGPIATVQAALRMVEDADALLLHPVDHPLVEPETVRTLIRTARESPEAGVVVPAVGEETGHPVLFRSALFPELLEPDLEEGARTVVRRDRDRVLEVQVNDPGVLADLNTLGDYRRHFPGSYRKRFQKW